MIKKYSNSKYNSGILALVFAVLTALGSCLPEEPDFPYKNPFYTYGGITKDNTQWAFVIDHRNDYFAATRNSVTIDVTDENGDTIEDDDGNNVTENVILEIEGNFDRKSKFNKKGINHLVLTISKTNRSDILAKGTSWSAFENGGRFLFIYPNPDKNIVPNSEFSQGFFLTRIEVECSNQRALFVNKDEEDNYNWLQTGFDPSQSYDIMSKIWGTSATSDEVINNAEAALILVLQLSSSGVVDTGGVDLSALIDLENTFAMTHKNAQLDQELTDLVTSNRYTVSTCLFGDLNSFGANEQELIDATFPDASEVANLSTFEQAGLLDELAPLAATQKFAYLSPIGMLVHNYGSNDFSKISLALSSLTQAKLLVPESIYGGLLHTFTSGEGTVSIVKAVIEADANLNKDTLNIYSIGDSDLCDPATNPLLVMDHTSLENGSGSIDAYYESSSGSIDYATAYKAKSIIDDGKQIFIVGINQNNDPYFGVLISKKCSD